MKEMMCVCVGSCFGGCLRYLVGRWMELWVPAASFTYATLAFTTFSTFMNDNLLMARDGQMLAALLYTVLSMVLGMAAVVAGYQVVK